MKQYRVVYKVDGEGYTDDLPWIYDSNLSSEEAVSYRAEAEAWLMTMYRDIEVWIEEGEVPAWHRVDLV